MLSHSCKTAIKAVIYLAAKHDPDLERDGSRESLREIAENIQASEHTVGKLLQLLVRQNVINSTKGPGGGFYLDKQQLNQPVINIVYAIDGRNIFKECGLGLNKCSEKHPCPIHYQYKIARDHVENLFRTKKVSELSEVVNAGISFLHNA